MCIIIVQDICNCWFALFLSPPQMIRNLNLANKMILQLQMWMICDDLLCINNPNIHAIIFENMIAIDVYMFVSIYCNQPNTHWLYWGRAGQWTSEVVQNAVCANKMFLLLLNNWWRIGEEYDSDHVMVSIRWMKMWRHLKPTNYRARSFIESESQI